MLALSLNPSTSRPLHCTRYAGVIDPYLMIRAFLIKVTPRRGLTRGAEIKIAEREVFIRMPLCNLQEDVQRVSLYLWSLSASRSRDILLQIFTRLAFPPHHSGPLRFHVRIPTRRLTRHFRSTYALLSRLVCCPLYTSVRIAGVRGHGGLAWGLVCAALSSTWCVLGAETVLYDSVRTSDWIDRAFGRLGLAYFLLVASGTCRSRLGHLCVMGKFLRCALRVDLRTYGVLDIVAVVQLRCGC